MVHRDMGRIKSAQELCVGLRGSQSCIQLCQQLSLVELHHSYGQRGMWLGAGCCHFLAKIRKKRQVVLDSRNHRVQVQIYSVVEEGHFCGVGQSQAWGGGCP